MDQASAKPDGNLLRRGAAIHAGFSGRDSGQKIYGRGQSENELRNEEVLLKKSEGELWCKYASIVDADNKKWRYRLIADERIHIGDSMASILGFAEDMIDLGDE